MKRGVIILFIAFLVCQSVNAGEAQAVAAVADTCDCNKVSSFHWIKQLFDNRFRVNDPGVCYPRFPKFALKVYNWGDRTFNSYNTDYVVGTGKNWKLQGKSFNWMETSTMFFPNQSLINMHSDLYSDAGFSLSFMAVSIGYMWNINKLFTDPTNRRTFSLDFTCSRFSINYQTVSSTGGMILTKFGSFNNGHVHYKFDDCSSSSKTFDAYWFFNNYKYSQGAAYSYSKYQLKNAGTALVGFNYAEQKVSMDFASLPPQMVIFFPLEDPLYSCNYRSYNVLGGYAYNWVLKPRRWLVNAQGMVAVGYRKLADSDLENDARSQFSSNFRVNLALVYNHRALFASLTARTQGFLNFNTGDMTHFNSYMSFTGTVGMRF